MSMLPDIAQSNAGATNGILEELNWLALAVARLTLPLTSHCLEKETEAHMSVTT